MVHTALLAQAAIAGLARAKRDIIAALVWQSRVLLQPIALMLMSWNLYLASLVNSTQ